MDCKCRVIEFLVKNEDCADFLYKVNHRAINSSIDKWFIRLDRFIREDLSIKLQWPEYTKTLFRKYATNYVIQYNLLSPRDHKWTVSGVLQKGHSVNNHKGTVFDSPPYRALYPITEGNPFTYLAWVLDMSLAHSYIQASRVDPDFGKKWYDYCKHMPIGTRPNFFPLFDKEDTDFTITLLDAVIRTKFNG